MRPAGRWAVKARQRLQRVVGGIAGHAANLAAEALAARARARPHGAPGPQAGSASWSRIAYSAPCTAPSGCWASWMLTMNLCVCISSKLRDTDGSLMQPLGR